jgi:hypothetical protein
LPGHRKKIAQIFNEDFYLPLYLPLWSDLSVEWLRAGDQKAKVVVIQHLQGETQSWEGDGDEASLVIYTPACTAGTFPSVFSEA